MTSRALRSLKSLNNSKLPDLTRDVCSISVLHLPCEFANIPEELKESQKKAEALGQKMAGSMMKIMPYMNDPEVQKAQERMGAAMTEAMK